MKRSTGQARAAMEAALNEDLAVTPKSSAKSRKHRAGAEAGDSTLVIDDKEQTSVLSVRIENSFIEKLRSTQASLYEERGKLYSISKIAGSIIRDHYKK